MSKVINKTISDEVLDKTMHVFWEKGYFNTSVDELIEATGFNRRAIYSYFGSKHDLFLAVLKRYRNEITPQFTAPLKNTAAGHTAIDDFFAFALAGTIYAEAFRDNTSGGYPGAMDGRDRGSGCMG